MIKDFEGKEQPLQNRVPYTQFDIDAKCRVCAADGTIFTKLYGSGIAYPTRTNDGMIRPEAGKLDPRADSYSLYSGWVANRILMNVIPKSMLDSVVHKVKNPKAIQIKKQENNNDKTESLASPSKLTPVLKKPTTGSLHNTEPKKQLNKDAESPPKKRKEQVAEKMKSVSPMKPQFAVNGGDMGYLKGTHTSNNRASLLTEQKHIVQSDVEGAAESHVEGPFGGVFIPP